MSTFSSATLFFGVCINVMTLAFAGRAWTRVEPVFLAIDLIRARRRRGNLRVIDAPAGHTTVADLPDEVWALIKAEVTAPSYDAEVESFVAEWHETDQSLFPDEDDPEYVEPKTIEHFRACASCFHAIQERGGVDEFLEENIETTQNVVEAFSLTLAQQHMLSFEGEPGTAWMDWDATYAISLPFTGLERVTEYPSASCQVNHPRLVSEDANVVVEVDPHVFTLPPDARSRFDRFLTTFPKLETVYHPHLTMVPKSVIVASSQQDVQGHRATRDRRDEEEAKGRSPRWLVWNYTHLKP